MKRKNIFLLALIFVLSCQSLCADNVEVGQWRTHFAMASILQMTQRHDEIWACMSHGLMCVDTRDQCVSELNRVHGLSGTDLSTVAYSALHDILLVGYTDGRLDFVYGDNEIFTLYDIARKDIMDGKAVRHIFMAGRYAYLSMPFGVVVVDLQKQEIKETYFIGENNTSLQINGICVAGNTIYAATDRGLRYADLSSPNLNDYAAWKTDTLWRDSQVLYVVKALGRIVVGNGHEIYWGSRQDGWRLFLQFENNGEMLTALQGNARHIAVGISDSLQERGYVDVYDADKKKDFSTGRDKLRGIQSLLWAEDGTLWVGSNIGECNSFDIKTGNTRPYYIPGPTGNTIFELSSTGKGVTMACGGFSESFAPLPISFGGNFFYNECWMGYAYGNLLAGGINPTIMSVTQTLEDPFELGHLYFSSALGGLVEKTADDKWYEYNAENSPLQNNRVDEKDCRVNGMAFDREGNLWMINAFSTKGLVCKRRDGTWKSYDFRVVGNSDARPKAIMADYWGTKWVIFGNNELSIFKTNGDAVQALIVDLNQGNSLHTSNVFCLVEDQLGHVWIGTDRGVKVIDQHARMFDSPNGNKTSVNAKTIRVPKDGFLIELLNTDQVRAIAVDGANRKWIGTQGDGVYLVSADGLEEIHHFTTENSPLLSDNITDIAVYNKTGEVFIGTDKGLIAYRGTATVTEGNPKDEARAFPNPVRPGYQGFINVRGLPQNAIVKITDTRGVLIYQGQATGGQLSWDGYALNGKRPNSGVLFVFACAEDGSQKLACKIFYVR